MMLAGISTACFYPEPTELALGQIAKNGVRATEVFLNSASELEPQFLQGLRETADAHGTRILSVHPFTSAMEPMLFFSDYPRRFADGREYYRRYYQAANLLGAEIVVFHGNLSQFDICQEEYFQRFAILMEDARSEGVKLCHENVCRCMGRSPGFFREMSRYLPNARYVFDVKQAVRAGEDVMKFADAMGERMVHVHISDHDGENACLSIGKGVFHIQNFLSQLNSWGYEGGVLVELYRENYTDFVELYDGYQQLCRYISTKA